MQTPLSALGFVLKPSMNQNLRVGEKSFEKYHGRHQQKPLGSHKKSQVERPLIQGSFPDAKHARAMHSNPCF